MGLTPPVVNTRVRRQVKEAIKSLSFWPRGESQIVRLFIREGLEKRGMWPTEDETPEEIQESEMVRQLVEEALARK